MNYRHVPMRCKCGEVPDRIDEVGLTDRHELVVHWWCSRCRKVVYIVKSLAECWQECPTEQDSLERRLAQLEALGYCAEDADFLRRMGVRVS